MSSLPQLPFHPIGLLWAAVTLFVFCSAWYLPLYNSVVTHSEGPTEHVSHLVLAGAAALWLNCAVRLRAEAGSRRIVACVVSAYVMLLFVEEIDWGSVYGLTVFSSAIHATLGVPALHHTTWENTSMFVDKLFWFAIPGMLWFSFPRIPAECVRGWSEQIRPLAPTASESRWFFVSLATYLAADMLVPVSSMDLYQMMAYVVFGASAWRAGQALRSGASE